jgi:hypothetical protein
MSTLKFIKGGSFERLVANITTNEKRYSDAAPWLDSYFGGSSWSVPSDIVAPESIELQMPKSKIEHFDLENTRIVYSALKHLSPVQASDPRLWAYFTHISHWDYMRARWPAEQYVNGNDFRNVMQQRYFFMGDRSRAPLRNGMARLWWYGYSSYDSTREDPFELTGPLLKTLDITQNLLENAQGRSVQIMQTVLKVVQERSFYKREEFRSLANYINNIGGVTIIDALPAEELSDLVSRKIDQLTGQAA